MSSEAWFEELIDRYPPPVVVDGIPCYSPDLEEAVVGYDSEFHRELAELEPGNWWFESRNALIRDALCRWFPGMSSFLEIGCGTGFVLQGVLGTYPQLPVVGSEVLTSGLEKVRARLPGVPVVQMDARSIPFEAEFSVVGAFDVLEHIEEHEEVLVNVHNALEPRGGLVLTVPQHEWMWSLADVQAGHVRRYTRRTLHEVVEAAGFDILWGGSFVGLLAPAMLVSRLRGDKKRQEDPLIDFRLSSRANRALMSISSMERLLINRGVRLPVGGSRIVVARRA